MGQDVTGRRWKVASGLRGHRRLLGLGLQEALVEQAVVLFAAWQGEAGGAGWDMRLLKPKQVETQA